MPVEPPHSPWQFPTTDEFPPGQDLVVIGADLEPGTILSAYRSGLFPMPIPDPPEDLPPNIVGWWAPEARGVLPLDEFHVSRSLRRSVRRFTTSVNKSFDRVIAACADPARPYGWINEDIVRAYRRLHELGWVHSVETWDERGELVGGLYGVAIGGLFAGESMFSHASDASKVALVALVDRLRARGFVLLDVQWATDHLRSLGAREVDRETYADLLASALKEECVFAEP